MLFSTIYIIGRCVGALYETVTAIGVRLDSNEELILAAPFGIQDLLTLQVRPIPYFETSTSTHPIHVKRMAQITGQSSGLTSNCIHNTYTKTRPPK